MQMLRPSGSFGALVVRARIVLSVSSLAVVQAGCAGSQHAARPAAGPAGTPVEGISVTGTGKVFGQPNMARATVGVEARATTADAAMRDVNAGVARVIAAVQGAGVAQNDVMTQNLSLHFEREEAPPPRPMVEPPSAAAPKGRPGTPPASDAPEAQRAPAGRYRAQNTVVIKIRNLDKVGATLGAAMGAGANVMFGLAFEIEEPRQLEEQAREKAMVDARARAEGLARLAGVRLGSVVSIEESSGGSPGPGPMMYRAQAADVPIEHGELLVTTTVHAVYSIAR